MFSQECVILSIGLVCIPECTWARVCIQNALGQGCVCMPACTWAVGGYGHPSPEMATAAFGTHPTGMHPC